jgi:hypothetical protein
MAGCWLYGCAWMGASYALGVNMIYTMGDGAWSIYWDVNTQSPPNYLIVFGLINDGVTCVLPVHWFCEMCFTLGNGEDEDAPIMKLYFGSKMPYIFHTTRSSCTQ